MQKIINLYYIAHYGLFSKLKYLDGLAPLALRLYLVPIFWMAGTHKIDFETLMPFASTVAWFGNSEWGLGLPAPELMAFVAGWTEVLGAILLALGLATRWISLPLMATMVVAAVTVHLEFGWQAIADPSAAFANERVLESAERLARAKDILQEHGNYFWLTARGSLVVLNNGIEFAATYFIMCLALLFSGGGRYFSVDYWLSKLFKSSNQ
ncbi:DoxX family protein [Halieaceae bacterium]|nr:DoxX family protein [Halieaceae bacterium]